MTPADIDCDYLFDEYNEIQHSVCQDGVCTCTPINVGARHTDACSSG